MAKSKKQRKWTHRRLTTLGTALKTNGGRMGLRKRELILQKKIESGEVK